MFTYLTYPYRLQRNMMLLIVCMFLLTTQSATAQSTIPNVEVIVLLDESGSMWEYTDVEQRRDEAIDLLANTLAVDRSRVEFKFSLITFNSNPNTLQGGFIDLEDSAARSALFDQLSQREKPVNEQRYTDVLLALEAAKSLLDTQHDPAYKPIIVLISDGQPESLVANHESAPAVWNAYREDVEAFATQAFQDVGYQGSRCGRTLGVPIHTLALRVASSAEDYSAEDKGLWQRISRDTGGNYYELIADSSADFQALLPERVDDLTSQMLCLTEIETTESIPVSGETTIEIDIERIDEAISFNVFKTGVNMSLDIYDASGQQVGSSSVAGTTITSRGETYDTTFDATTSFLTESWGFARATDGSEGWVGTWRLVFNSIDGSDGLDRVRVTTRKSSDLIQLEIEEPQSGFVASGGDVTVKVNINAEGNEGFVPTGADLQIVCEDGQSFVDEAPAILNDIIFGTVRMDGATEGACQVLADVQVADDSGEEFNIQVEKDVVTDDDLPRIFVVAPTAMAAVLETEPPSVEIEVFSGNDPYPALTGQDKAIASIIDVNSRETVAEIPLTMDDSVGANGGTLFNGTVAQELPSGTYLLDVSLSAFPPGAASALPPQRSFLLFDVGNTEPTPTPTMPPVVEPTDTVPVPTPVPTEPPEPQEPRELPAWLFPLCGSIFVILAGLWFLSQRMVGSGGWQGGILVDETNNLGIQHSLGFGFLERRTVTFRDPDYNQNMVRLRAEPQGDEVLFQVRGLQDGVTVFRANEQGQPGQQLPEDEPFMLQNGQNLIVRYPVEDGERTATMRLRYEENQPNFPDDSALDDDPEYWEG